jgi:hypothetical protein
MGMFDYLRSSYNLGEQFTDIELHTKDIEDGIGGTMSHYWLSPDGHLYYIDYSGTADFVELKEGDEDYDEKRKFLNFKWVSNGNRGKISPWLLTKYIRIYPPQWDGEWTDWPTLRLRFHYGKLMEYEDITGTLQ